MSGILIDVNARTSQSEKDLARINESLKNIEKSTNAASKALSTAFVGLSTAVLSGGGLVALKNISNEFTNIENKIALITGRSQELLTVQKKLFDIAEDTRGSLSATVGVFSSFGRSLKDVGASTQNILKATKTVQQAVALSGASAEAAAAALVQLGQGLSAGALRGEELNSVLEQTPRIASAIADELGVSVGKMRLLAAEGKLTSSVVFNALLNQSQKISKEFATLTPTISQSTNLLTDSLKIYFNELDKGLGVSASVSKTLVNVAKIIKSNSDNAFELGNRLALGLLRTRSAITSILGPISKIGVELSKQFLKVIPTATLTRTLVGDFRQIIRTFDKELLGGLLTSFNKLRFIDLITVESDVQKAVRKLKRLSPSNWAAAGFDVKSIQQFLSRENLNLYAAAFGDLAKAITSNTTSFGSTFVTATRKVDAFFKSISRYIGLRPDTIIAFTRGQLDTFFVTLAEITRGISGIGVKVFEFNRLVVDNLLPGLNAFGLAVSDIFKSLPNIFSGLIKSVVEVSSRLVTIVTQILKEISYSELELNFKEVLNNLLNVFSSFIDALEDKTALTGPLDKLENFGRRVIEIFRDIYDKVIGNSWWTDTIDNVVDTSSSLWDKTASGLNSFKNNTIKVFKSIFKAASGFDFNFSKIKISSETLIPKLSAGGLIEAFQNAFNSARNLAIEFFDAFPNIAKAAMVATAGVLVYNLFPPSVLKTVILSSILTSLATSGTLIAEKFGAALTGGSLAATVGYALGQSVGFFLNSFIKDLPDILNSILGFISNFFRGIAEKLPGIGSIVSGIFSVFSGLGVAGPAGVLGAYFFGKNLGLFKLLAKLEPLKSFLEFFEIKLDGDDGKKTKKGGKRQRSKFAKSIDANIGRTRATSIGLLLAQSFGAFEAVFSNSILAKYATTGGLLYTSLFGEEGLNKIIDTFKSKILGPLGVSLRDFAQKSGGPIKDIYDVIFGNTGTVGERLGKLVQPILGGIGLKIVDYATPFAEKTFDFFKTLLFGKNPSRTIRLLKVQAGRLVQDISESVANFAKPLTKSFTDFLDNRRYQSWLRKNANAQQSAAMPQQSSFDQFADQASRTAQRVGGENGLLGRLFLGKYSKQILIGSVLALGTAFAFAAENANAAAKSPFDRLVEDVKSIDLLGPFKQITAEMAMVIVPGIIASFIFLRTEIFKIFAEIKAAGIAAMSAAGLGGMVGGGGRRARNQPSAIVTTGAAAAGGLAVGSIFGEAMGMAVGFALFSVIQALPAKILKYFTFASLGRVLAGGLALLVNPLTWAILGTATVAGAAYVWLFGESGEFFTDLQTAIDKAKELVGIKPSAKPSSRGLSQEDEKFLRQQQIETKFGLENVNLKGLNEADTKKLADRTKEFSDAIERARDEQERTGKVSKDTVDDLVLLDKGLQNFTTKLALKTTKDISPVRAIEDLTIMDPRQNSAKIVRNVQQFFNSAFYEADLAAVKIARAFAPTPELKAVQTERLQELKSLKDTEYNAFYRPLRETEKALLDLAKSAENVTITNDQLEVDLLKVRQQYEKNAQIVKGREISAFGTFKALPENDPDKVALRISELDYIDKLKAKVEFDRQQRAIRSFTKEIDNLDSTFKNVLDLDLGKIFAVDNQDILKLKDLERQAKFLGEQLKNVSDIAQRNEITIRITEIKRQVIEIQENAKVELDTRRPQFILKELYEKAGLNRTNEFYESLSDTAAKALINATKEYNKSVEASKVKPIDPLVTREAFASILKGQYPTPAVPGGLEALTQSQSLENVNADLAAKTRAIVNAERDFVRGTAAEIQLYQGLAERIGLNFDQLVTKFGVSGAFKTIDALDKKLKDLESAKKTRGDTRVRSLTQQIETFREEINKTPLDFPGILSQISSGGFSIAPEDIINTKGIIPDLKSIANEFLAVEARFKRLGTSFKESDIEDVIRTKLKASERLFNVFLKTVGNTPNKIFDIFSRFGLGDASDINRASASVKSSIIDLERLRLTLDEIGKTSALESEFSFISALKEKLESLADFVKNKFSKTFSGVFNKINSTLETGLSEAQYASLPEELTKTLSVYSEFLDRNLENVRKKGVTIAEKTPREFFARFDEYLRKVKFVKFISDLSNSIASVATDGLKTQFEKFSEAVGDTIFNKQTFAELPKEVRQQLTERAVTIKGLESALDLPGLTEEQLAILDRFRTEPGNVKQILDAFIANLSANLSNIPADIRAEQDKFLKAQTDPADRTINALDTTSIRLLELKGAVENLTTKINNLFPATDIPGKASGGWVSGPGTGTSDSIHTMLSDGEFVVNAESAKKNKLLLELINDSNKNNLFPNNAFATPKVNPLDSLGVEVGGGLLRPAKVGKGYGFKWGKKFADGGINMPSSITKEALDRLFKFVSNRTLPEGLSDLSAPFEVPRGFEGKLTDWNTKYADFSIMQTAKDDFSKQLKEQFGLDPEKLTLNDQIKFRKALDQYYKGQLDLYQFNVKNGSVSVDLKETDNAKAALQSFFAPMLGHAQDMSMNQMLQAPSIQRISNLRVANAIKAHEFGHMLSFGRTFDTEKYKSFAQNLPLADRVAFGLGAAYDEKEGMSHVSAVNFKKQAELMYSTGLDRGDLLDYGAKSFQEMFDKYGGNLKLLEETNANNIGSALSPIGQIWDDAPKAFRSYQVEDEFLKLEKSDLTKFKKIFKGVSLGIESVRIPGQLVEALETMTPALDIPAPTPKPTMADRLSGLKDKIPSISSIKDKFKRPSSNLLASNESSSLWSAATGKYGDLLGVGAGLGQAFYGMSEHTSSVDLNDDFMTAAGALITKAKGAGVYNLATYMKELNPINPDFEIMRQFNENKLKAASIEKARALYKPSESVKSTIKIKPDEARKLINFEDYLSSKEFLDKQLKKSLGISSSASNRITNPDFFSNSLMKKNRRSAGGSIFGPGTGTSDSIPAWLSNGEFVVNAKATKKNLKLLEAINSAKGFYQGGISGDTSASASGLNIRPVVDIGALAKAFADALKSVQTEAGGQLPGISKMLFRAKALNLDFDELKVKSLEPASQKQFESLVNKAYEDQLAAAKNKTPELIRRAAESLTAVEDFIEESFPKFVDKVKESSVNFANSISSAVNDAVKGLLKGETDGDKSVWKTFTERLLNNITNSIINSFVDGLMDPLTGKDGIITNFSKELGQNLFKGGAGTTSLFSNFFKKNDAKTAAAIPVETRDLSNISEKPPAIPVEPTSVDKKQLSATQNLSSTLGAGIAGLAGIAAGAALIQGNGFQKLIGILTITNSILTLIQAFSAISAIPFFASGGIVKGPGTGTSDSISAMLSNGEFVVNAKATKDNLNLLTAINNGSVKRFAAGGLVSTAMIATPAMAEVKAANTSSNSQQVVNINITGDISRQTKAQIYQMLPTIAQGVNAQNRERGYRG